jgi:hypothetical protein
VITKIGEISSIVIKTLGLSIEPGAAILIGEANVNHIKQNHPTDYNKYGNKLVDIISAPDYVSVSTHDSSISYVKEFIVDNEYVKVAVRISGGGVYYVRSMYVLNTNRVRNFIEKGTLKPLTR